MLKKPKSFFRHCENILKFFYPKGPTFNILIFDNNERQKYRKGSPLLARRLSYCKKVLEISGTAKEYWTLRCLLLFLSLRYGAACPIILIPFKFLDDIKMSWPLRYSNVSVVLCCISSSSPVLISCSCYFAKPFNSVNSLLRVVFDPLFWVLLIHMDFVAMKHPPVGFSGVVLTVSNILSSFPGLSSLTSSFWDWIIRVLILISVITPSFRDVLNLS